MPPIDSEFRAQQRLAALDTVRPFAAFTRPGPSVFSADFFARDVIKFGSGEASRQRETRAGESSRPATLALGRREYVTRSGWTTEQDRRRQGIEGHNISRLLRGNRLVSAATARNHRLVP